MERLYPIYINKKSPCYSKDHIGNTGCPARNDIPRFLHLIKLKRFSDAFYVLKETNPFSAGCGRFCDHPCETACNRAKFDEPVDIKALERFIADWGYKNGLTPIKKRSRNNKQIAIIGSGPSGLSCAYFLAINGYNTVVYEKHKEAGGLLTEGIPTYRYPREIFYKELEFIKKAGVKIVTDFNVDKNRFLNITEEFDAVIVATGANSPNYPGIEGERLEGVQSGLEFLRKINLGEVDKLKIVEGEKIAVIGGGYTAFDVARVATRLKAKPMIIYRRTETEMTAHPGELKDTRDEGVDFKFLLQPYKIKKINNKLKLICQKMKLGAVDESGRSKPIPLRGKFEEIEADRIIFAIGDNPNLYFVGDRFFIEYPRLHCPDLREELIKKIFVTGDAAMGSAPVAGMVVRAIGLAQDTALAVRNFLGEEIEEYNRINDIAYFDNLNTKYFEKSSRAIEEKLKAEERRDNFDEIVKTIDESIAPLMAERCFFCGICIQCDWCYYYSHGSIIKIKKEWSKDIDEYFYYFIKEKLGEATYKSVEACPRAALSVVKEKPNYKKYIDKQYIDNNAILKESKK
ncbi:MAG: FAD-dependent oxidoreductase [Deferribacterota bacterium]|nr:FAD-dependent oxidoreductase [Deferribacterota bacterium]